ncbi:MAG: histidine phosphatase family protein [Ruminococcus sp.]|nr:histidine phosphatase family protein [Ruminococcus sp.]
MRIDFIRHGKTEGNLEMRYIGRTDETLCFKGITELAVISYPPCGKLISSPMKRCLQTAELIFPNTEFIICDSLRECDFGDFEGRNYIELSLDSRYQRWIDSGGEMPFPNGEAPSDFKKRSVDGFLSCLEDMSDEAHATFVVHGGTIMAVMEHFAVPKKNYYDWHTANGHGFVTEYDGEKITVMEKI